MIKINPYLNFLGTTEEALNFYVSVFGGKVIHTQRFKDTPEAGQVPAADADKIMHMAISIGKDTVLMGTDVLESQGRTHTPGNNFYLSVSAESEPEADKIFNGLSAGGKVNMPLQKTFWGSYFGMVNDKFGIQWMVDCDPKQPK